MGLKKILLLANALALSTFAAPIPECDGDQPGTQLPAVTADIIKQIAPSTASCTAGGEFASECADATRAAAALNSAFEHWQITSREEQAALIAYMMYESGNFTYNKNHFPAPGRPGQGTRMMAMSPFIAEYAAAVVDADQVAAASALGGDAAKVAMLDLVNSDDALSFGSAAWYLNAHCPYEDIRDALKKGEIAGWNGFLVTCVGTTHTPDRDPLYFAAKQAMLSG